MNQGIAKFFVFVVALQHGKKGVLLNVSQNIDAIKLDKLSEQTKLIDLLMLLAVACVTVHSFLIVLCQRSAKLNRKAI